MIRAVLDVNAVASGMVRFRTGANPPAVILRTWVNGEFELLISDHILQKVVSTLAKPYFLEHVDIEVYREMLEALADHATRVRITHSVSGVASHPEDDRVLEAAVSAEADYLATGDGSLRKVESYWRCNCQSCRLPRDTRSARGSGVAWNGFDSIVARKMMCPI